MKVRTTRKAACAQGDRWAVLWVVMLATLSALLTTLASAAQAQDLHEQFLPPVESQPVRFEPEAKRSIGLFTSLANTTFKPQGYGPFPAVVLMHTCGGVRVPHIQQHAEALLKAGFVVLVVDSFGPRGLQNCGTRVLSGSAGVLDAYAALAHLSAQPYVDKDRIHQVGYSWGAIVSAWLASPQSAAFAGSKARFASSVAHYATCRYQDRYQFVLRDVDRPLLMLLAGDDQELPIAPCFPLLEELKAAGAPVQWHRFDGATHAWDQNTRPERGYRHDAAVTEEANRRLLAFLQAPR